MRAAGGVGSIACQWAKLHGCNLDLIEAIKGGDVKKLKSLIKAGANVNTVSADNMTPLIMLGSIGSVDVVRELISAGADVNATNINGSTPFW